MTWLSQIRVEADIWSIFTSPRSPLVTKQEGSYSPVRAEYLTWQTQAPHEEVLCPVHCANASNWSKPHTISCRSVHSFKPMWVAIWPEGEDLNGKLYGGWGQGRPGEDSPLHDHHRADDMTAMPSKRRPGEDSPLHDHHRLRTWLLCHQNEDSLLHDHHRAEDMTAMPPKRRPEDSPLHDHHRAEDMTAMHQNEYLNTAHFMTTTGLWLQCHQRIECRRRSTDLPAFPKLLLTIFPLS
jgi:hypothetical protein